MPTYLVIRKTDGAEMTSYCAGEVTEQINTDFYPQTDFDHVEWVEGTAPVVSGPRRLTKLQFIARLGDAAFGAILTMAKSSIEVEAFMKLFELATPEADGTSIDLDDPRTAAGVVAIGLALEAQGIVQSGWAQGVLNGE